MAAALMSRHPDERRPVLGILGLLVLVAVGVPALAGADASVDVRPADEAPVELLRPADGEVLEAGREATVAWRAVRDLAAEGIREWEAFLSFDGGRHWPVRVTPHLDADRPSFRFTVPAVASDDVRLMLRFGDEVREVGYVLPLRLRTVVPPGARTPLAAPAVGPGEAARPGAPGVVLWVEGSRDGARTTTRSATLLPPVLRATTTGRPPRGWPVATAPERRTNEAGGDRTAGAAPARPVSRGAPPNRSWPAVSLPLLLLLCRRDE